MAQKFNKYGANHLNNPFSTQPTLLGLGWFYKSNEVGKGFSLSAFESTNPTLFSLLKKLNNNFTKICDEFVEKLNDVSTDARDEFIRLGLEELDENVMWFNETKESKGGGNDFEVTSVEFDKISKICADIQLLSALDAIPSDDTNGMMYVYSNESLN